MKTRCLQMPFNPRDSVARSLAWSFLEQGGSKVVTLFVQIVLARILAPEEFGIMAILLVLVNVADAVSQSGLGTALIQKSKTTDVECSTAFWLSMAVASLLFCLLFTVAPVVSAFYGERSFTPLLRVLSVVIVFNSMNSILRSRLQSAMDFKGLFKANVLAIVVSSAFGVGLALSGFGIWALVIQVVSQSACATLMLYLAASWRPSLLFDREAAKELFGYGWKICATGILNVLYMGASDLIIGKACSTGDLGYYSQGRKWPGAVVSIASNALQNVFFPVFSSLKDDSSCSNDEGVFAFRIARSRPCSVFLRRFSRTYRRLASNGKMASERSDISNGLPFQQRSSFAIGKPQGVYGAWSQRPVPQAPSSQSRSGRRGYLRGCCRFKRHLRCVVLYGSNSGAFSAACRYATCHALCWVFALLSTKGFSSYLPSVNCGSGCRVLRILCRTLLWCAIAF